MNFISGKFMVNLWAFVLKNDMSEALLTKNHIIMPNYSNFFSNYKFHELTVTSARSNYTKEFPSSWIIIPIIPISFLKMFGRAWQRSPH